MDNRSENQWKIRSITINHTENKLGNSTSARDGGGCNCRWRDQLQCIAPPPSCRGAAPRGGRRRDAVIGGYGVGGGGGGTGAQERLQGIAHPSPPRPLRPAAVVLRVKVKLRLEGGGGEGKGSRVGGRVGRRRNEVAGAGGHGWRRNEVAAATGSVGGGGFPEPTICGDVGRPGEDKTGKKPDWSGRGERRAREKGASWLARAPGTEYYSVPKVLYNIPIYIYI
jgi:hypothetical protein